MLTKDDLEKNLIRVHEWIKSADQKVGIFLAFQGIVFTLLSGGISSWINNFGAFPYKSLFLLVPGTILIAYSILVSIISIIPQLIKDNNKKSITFFGDIAKFNLIDFRKTIKKMTVEKYENELIEQIHVSSKIAVRKHIQFRKAIFTFFIGMTLLICVFYCFK